MDLATHWIGRYARMILVDFHVPPQVAELGRGFDAAKFAEDMVKANVNVVGIYAKCHYGFSYYDTRIGTRHPGLNFDYFRSLSEACKARDLKVFAYYSVARDSLAYDNNPDWRQVDAEGKSFRLAKGDWGVVCFNSPYTQEVVWPQLREILEKYDVDGVWWDIVTFEPGSCFCRYCKSRMEAEGVDPLNRRAHHAFNERSIARFHRESYELIKSYDPSIQITSNSTGKIGRARRNKDWLDLLVTEYIPYRHGFLYYAPYAHYMRTMGLPMDCAMSSWHKAWGDFGNFKTLVQFQYEIAHVMSAGAVCQVVHQPDVDCNFSSDIIDLLGNAYGFAREREEWCIGAKSVPYVAVLADPDIGEFDDERHAGSLRGAVKALLEGHIPFDVIDEEADFKPYRVVILPNNRTLSSEASDKIREYVANGGKLIATHLASLATMADESPDFTLGDVFGVSYQGLSPESIGFLTAYNSGVGSGLPRYPLVVYDRFLEVSHFKGAEVLAEARRPLLELLERRSYSHAQPPPHPTPPSWPDAIIRNRYGKGVSIYLVSPVFRVFYEHNAPFHRKLIQNLIDLLLGDDKLVEVETGPSVEASLMEQDDRWVLHLVNYHAERRATLPLPTGNRWGLASPMPNPRLPYNFLPAHEVIEEIPPRFNIKVRIRLPSKPKVVYKAPSREKVDLNDANGISELTVDRLDIHQMIVFEFR